MGKVKLLTDKFMLILSNKTKYWRFIGVLIVITLAAIAVGAAYIMLKDVIK